MQPQQTFPFIVGCPRSGTTLLRAMLDSHPELAIPPESFFVPEFGALGPAEFDPEAFSRQIAANERFQRWGLTVDDLPAAVRQAQDGPDAIRILYGLYAQHQGKRLYGDKTPQYATEIDELAAMFPEARFVHLIRDGRAVALSMLDAPFGPSSVVHAARMWRHHVTSGRRASRGLGSRRYVEVRYEALVNDPEPELISLCEFLGLSFDHQMLSYFERADSIVAGTLHPHAHQRVHSPPTVGLRDWRQAMPRLQIGVFEALAGDLLTELGYERAFGSPKWGHQLEAGRQLTVGWAGKTRRRLMLYARAGMRRLRSRRARATRSG